jgi:ABC-type Co2+ transport system permease subunit
MSLIHNERTKLLANALDRASTTCFTVGIVTPAAGYLYNVSGFRAATGIAVLVAGLIGWFVAAVLLHLAARRVLGSLKP